MLKKNIEKNKGKDWEGLGKDLLPQKK